MEPFADTMDVDEMDIDLGTDANIEALEALEVEAMIPEEIGTQAETDGPLRGPRLMTGPEVQQEKVHIRGLDRFATEDVKRFSSEHFPPESMRIEWIDDTSANIHFASAEVASEALAAFQDPTALVVDASDPTTLRRAKTLSSHPQVELYVRLALASDVKQPRAHESSRYYLLNPDQDPRERRRGNGDGRGGRNFNDRRGGKRLDDEEKGAPFDVNLYDDDPSSLAARIQVGGVSDRSRPQKSSFSPRRNGSRRRRASGSEDELLPARHGRNGGGRLRDRSASPTTGGDGRLGFEESEESRMRRTRRRSFPPPTARLERPANAGKELLATPRVNAGKELIGGRTTNASRELMDRVTSSTSGILGQNGATRDLFSNHTNPHLNGVSTELFPSKTASSNHRRKAAFDAADGTGDLFSSRLETRLLNSPDGSRIKQSTLTDRTSTGASSDLAGRISGSSASNVQSGFSIRGAAIQEVNPGFSIRGAAGVNNARVKELFPDRAAGNEGKELFGRVSGQGRQRKTAEDMFT